MENKGILVLDGGMATELEKKGFNLNNDPLWSASILQSNPSAIVEVSKSYLESGADIITTASYQASINGFQNHLKLNYEESKELIKLSVALANKAKEEYIHKSQSQRDILIAGSVGPYGACLADGSEYNGNYCDNMTHEKLIEWHRPRIEILINAGVDVLAFETIPALKEAEALLKLLRDYPNTKAWLSFSCQSMHQTAHKEDISDVAKNCLKSSGNQLFAIGVNCCSPDFAYHLLQDISTISSGFPLIVYPNSGEKWEAGVGWTENKAKSIQSYLESWIAASATIIGGCCRTGPKDILTISEYVKNKL